MREWIQVTICLPRTLRPEVSKYSEKSIILSETGYGSMILQHIHHVSAFSWVFSIFPFHSQGGADFERILPFSGMYDYVKLLNLLNDAEISFTWKTKTHPEIFFLDGIIHAVIEQDPPESLLKFLVYNGPKLAEHLKQERCQHR